MVVAVAGTHAAIWFLSGDARLSRTAKDQLFKAAAARRRIALSSISVVEVVYLIEKNRLSASAYDDLRQALADPNHVLQEAPFNVQVVEAMRQVPRVDVPDMPDRIFGGTGLYLNVPVISRDGRIRASNIRSVW